MKRKSAKRRYRLRNWKDYNAALVRRGSLTFWVSEEALGAWRNEELSGKRGASAPYSDVAIETMAPLQAVYRLDLRKTQGLMESIVELLGVDLPVPDYSTLGRRRAQLAIALPYQAVQQAVHVVVDSTGVKVYGEGEWKVRQHGWSKRRTWHKLHLGVDEATGEVLAAVASTNNVSDDEVLEELLEQVEGEIEQVSADGSYDKRKCYDAIGKRKARAAIPPRGGARIWQHGNSKAERHARDENLRRIRKGGRAAWKRECGYHRRSLAETAMFRLKTLFGERLGARAFAAQAVELFVRCAALNRMTHLGMPDSYAVAP